MRQLQVPNKLRSQPSSVDLRYLDQQDQIPSQQQLQDYTYSQKINQSSQPQSNSIKNQLNAINKISKRKTLTKQSKGSSSVSNSTLKRNTSQAKGSNNINYTKLNSKKSSQFRQSKFSEFQMIYKTFNAFSTSIVTFNELILGLKSIGIQIQTQKKFQTIKNIYDEFVGKNDIGLDFEMFGKIAFKLLKQQKSKSNSDLHHLQKGYYYMVQQSNNIQWPFNEQDQNNNSSKELYYQFKSYVERLPNDKKYLTKNSLNYLVKYLNMDKQLTQKDIQNIVKFCDNQDKGYLTFEDVIKAIQGNHII